jgi:hypothetical protein
MTRNRTFLAAVSLGLVALVVASVAAAGPLRARHPGKRHPARKHFVRKHLFAPASIRGAAEVTAVILDPVTQQFAQVTFDRGRVTSSSGGSLTLQQKENGAVWRTQAFAVPSSAVVTFNGRSVALSQIPTGAAARIESSGPAGGAESVVRVNAYARGEAPLPSTNG